MNEILKIVRAPWNDEQIKALNNYQNLNTFHPYTCGFDRKNAKHLDGEGVLVATNMGWMCPYCDYTQDYAFEFSLISQEEVDLLKSFQTGKTLNFLETLQNIDKLSKL